MPSSKYWALIVHPNHRNICSQKINVIAFGRLISIQYQSSIFLALFLLLSCQSLVKEVSERDYVTGRSKCANLCTIEGDEAHTVSSTTTMATPTTSVRRRRRRWLAEKDLISNLVTTQVCKVVPTVEEKSDEIDVCHIEPEKVSY